MKSRFDFFYGAPATDAQDFPLLKKFLAGTMATPPKPATQPKPEPKLTLRSIAERSRAEAVKRGEEVQAWVRFGR